MKIGVLGTGIVGQVLGAGFIAQGHQVMMGGRDAHNSKAAKWVENNGANASAGTFAQCAAFGDLLVLATLWSGTENVLNMAGKETFAGKVIIDATNPLEFPTGAPPRLALGHNDSGGEQIQRWLPNAHIVKAFNSVGNGLMVKPDFPDGPPDMFICGNNDKAKDTVKQLCQELGWPTIDMGGIEGARLLEPLAMLWIAYGMNTNTWQHAFKLLRK